MASGVAPCGGVNPVGRPPVRTVPPGAAVTPARHRAGSTVCPISGGALLGRRRRRLCSGSVSRRATSLPTSQMKNSASAGTSAGSHCLAVICAVAKIRAHHLHLSDEDREDDLGDHVQFRCLLSKVSWSAPCGHAPRLERAETIINEKAVRPTGGPDGRSLGWCARAVADEGQRGEGHEEAYETRRGQQSRGS